MATLLTGASGFVGAFVQRRINCIPFDRLGKPIDLRDADDVRMAMGEIKPDAVIHLAAQSFVPASFENPAETYEINFQGTLNLLAALKMGVHLMRQGDYITDYEVKLGGKIAEVLCGGSVTPGTPVSEQYILDLEREGFKSLCGERKTQERIQYTLKTGKTLRN